MSIEKIRSILLSTKPYRESSLLVSLYSLQYGRINALVKGVRRNDKRAVPLERGYLIEHVAYIKQHRDLQLITDCQIADYYPGIRGNLEKTAMRDMVFNVIITAIRVSDPNVHLFSILTIFLSDLEKLESGSAGLLLHVSKTLFSIAGQLGFYLDFSRCFTCGKTFDIASSASLTIQDGALRCMDCTGPLSSTGRLLRSPIPHMLSLPDDALLDGKIPVGTLQEAMALFRVTTEYCSFHLDILKKNDAYQFIEQLYGQSNTKNHIDLSAKKENNCYQTAKHKEISCQIHQ